jgi:hypothetical protein
MLMTSRDSWVIFPFLKIYKRKGYYSVQMCELLGRYEAARLVPDRLELGGARMVNRKTYIIEVFSFFLNEYCPPRAVNTFIHSSRDARRTVRRRSFCVVIDHSEATALENEHRYHYLIPAGSEKANGVIRQCAQPTS